MRLLVTLPLLLAGCSSLADPVYPQPSADEAKQGYIEGRLADADMIEGKPVAKASEFPAEAVREVIAVSQAWDEYRDNNTIDALRSTSAYDRIVAKDCQWQRIDPDDISALSRPRLGKSLPGAYFCTVDIAVTQNDGVKAVSTEHGYFYQQAGSWMYIGGEDGKLVRQG